MVARQHIAGTWTVCATAFLAFICTAVGACRRATPPPTDMLRAATPEASSLASPREAAIAPECELQKAADGGDRLESLVSGCCVGHSIELKFPAIEIGAGSRVVQAL